MRRSGVVVFIIFLLTVSYGKSLLLQAQSEPDRLAPEEYDVWSCDWSKDGRIVFAGKEKGMDATQTRIWLYRPKADSAPVLWTGTGSLIDLSPQWAPDGSGVVMVRRLTGVNIHGMHSSIWWKAFPSGEGKKLTTGPWDQDPAWSPDGESVVFVRGDGPYRSALATVDKKGEKVKILLPMQDHLISAPYWARDGRIYFSLIKSVKSDQAKGNSIPQSLGDEKGSICFLEVKNGQVHKLFDDENDYRYPVVSPDGRYLAYVSTRGVTVETNKPQRDRGALYVYDFKSKKSHLVAEKVSTNGTPPRWSPDGKSLAFFSFRETRPAIWVVKWQ